MIVNKDFRKRVDFVLRQGWKNIEKMFNNEASKYDLTFSVGFTLIGIGPLDLEAFHKVSSQVNEIIEEGDVFKI